ncbi:MAG: protein-L-isoaspartate(D-aspartate) O-methyltransferase [Gammaproteobacteria bacterium]|nr:protein-L-isoaspartate(D-aspartate) O-methyltransferase [Gammaproteobacteria bacterium]MDH3412768.1 protein-L-isoaspartate(D-aspartate) O-methyltransferase [Gammaproteobacteria bacterium]
MKDRFHGIGMTSRRTRGRLIERLRAEGIRDERVLEALRAVPRHIFVDEALSSRAYEDTALPIGAGQTISQPFVVARMTEALVAGGTLDRVLEIGTGCGYQTAILSRFAKQVYSVERIQSLLSQARQRMHDLKIHNVQLRHGDGEKGWPEHAPFDGILVAAAPASIPTALIDQLGDGGRLVIPVGHGGSQDLKLITRSGDQLDEQILERVAFVPLVSGLG